MCSSDLGSYALSRDQTDFFVQSLQAMAGEMSTTIRQYLLRDLVRFNYGQTRPVPRFQIGPLRSDDIEQVMTMLSTFGAAEKTMVPLAFIEELTVMVARGLGMPLDKLVEGQKEKREELIKTAKTQEQLQMAEVKAKVDPVVTAAQQALTVPARPQLGGAPTKATPATVRSASTGPTATKTTPVKAVPKP